VTLSDGNLNALDPFFLSENDLHLKEGSPCIDKGKDDVPSIASTDKDGAPRKIGAAVDMGAYEYGTNLVQANFTGFPRSGLPPLNVKFINKSLGPVSSLTWDFGDGQTSTESHPIHVYENVGAYYVKLTIEGANGSDELTQNAFIIVGYNEPVADFTANPLSGNEPLTVNFTDASAGFVTSYLWNFGDGTTSSEANPTHIYTSRGSYKVTLTVMGPGGSHIKEKDNYINVFNVLNIPNEFRTIEQALESAQDGDTVRIADGIYKGEGYSNLTVEGKCIKIISQNGPNNCIIDGGGNNRAFTFINSPGSTLEGLTIRNCMNFFCGGAIYISGSSPTIKNCVFSDNTAGGGGGAICSYGGSPIVLDCSFYRNKGGSGGAIHSDSSTLNITNGVFAGNSAEYLGGALYFYKVTAKILNSSFSENLAQIGNGIYGFNSSITATNTILWDQPADEIFLNSGSTANITYSNVRGAYPGTGNIDADPLFTGQENLRLAAGSPCINQGNNTAHGLPETDRDGTQRIVAETVDIGAYEYGGTPIAEFIADLKIGAPPLLVNFIDRSGGTVTSWLWDFGDGSTSTEQNPSHEFTSAGSYRVVLTVTGPGGSDSETKTGYISVYTTYGSILYVEQNGICLSNAPCFDSIQAAIGQAPDGAELIVTEGSFNEDITVDAPSQIAIMGGYNAIFSEKTEMTQIRSLTIKNGRVILDGIEILP